MYIISNMKKQIIHKIEGHEFYFVKKIDWSRGLYKCDLCCVRKEIYSTGKGISQDLAWNIGSCWIADKYNLNKKKTIT